MAKLKGELDVQGRKRKNQALQVLASKEDMINGMTRSAAKKYLKELGVSDETIKKMSHKDVKESVNEETAAEKFARTNAEAKQMSMDKQKANLEAQKKPTNTTGTVKCAHCGMANPAGTPTCKGCGSALPSVAKEEKKEDDKKIISEAVNSNTTFCKNCGVEYRNNKNDRDNKCPRCGKKNINMPKEMVKEDMTTDKINSVGAAEGQLKAKNVMWDKTETLGNKTVWKKGGAIVGVYDPSWGTVKTGEDLLAIKEQLNQKASITNAPVLIAKLKKAGSKTYGKNDPMYKELIAAGGKDMEYFDEFKTLARKMGVNCGMNQNREFVCMVK
jgi:DNA-directed RNA polymerase subunit RPC12/RpoP